jgi:hypothetical protein
MCFSVRRYSTLWRSTSIGAWLRPKLLPMAKEIWELSGDAVNLAAMPLFHIGGGGWATAGMYEGCPA